MGILLSENANLRKKKKSFFDFIDFENIYVILGIFSFLIIIIIGLVFVFYNFFFVQNFDKFIGSVKNYNKNIIFIEGDGEKMKGLNYQENFLKEVEKKVKKVSEEKQKDLVGKLNFALPDVLEKEFVIKFFEDLFLTISSKDSPVVLTSVNVGSPTNGIIELGKSEESVYKKYPISLGFSCSDKEFNRILDIIQVSGLFDKRYYFRGEILPVMTVSSVAMNFGDKKTGNNGEGEIDDKSIKSRSLQIFMYSYGDKTKKIKK